MNKNLIYNITSRDDALQTLENLTGFKKSIGNITPLKHG